MPLASWLLIVLALQAPLVYSNRPFVGRRTHEQGADQATARDD
jgi:hypothetical protein